ncbi:MAG: hypothetical protein ACK56F_25330, partial [bacterium]
VVLPEAHVPRLCHDSLGKFNYLAKKYSCLLNLSYKRDCATAELVNLQIDLNYIPLRKFYLLKFLVNHLSIKHNL